MRMAVSTICTPKIAAKPHWIGQVGQLGMTNATLELLSAPVNENITAGTSLGKDSVPDRGAVLLPTVSCFSVILRLRN